MKAKAIFTCFFLFIIAQSFAQQFSLVSSMKGDVIQGQPFTVSYVLTGGRGGDFAPPEFKGFQVSGPSSKSEYRNINGKSSQSYSLVYTLVPLKPGVASIGPASIRVGNNRLLAEGLKFNVKAPSAGSQETGAPFLRAEISKDTVFLGEVVPLEYKLYIPYPYQKKGQRITIAPKFEGYFVENSSLYYSEEVLLDNVRYTAYIVDRKYLYPHQSGALKIPSITINYNVVHKNDRFGFFGNSGQSYTSRSEEKLLEVLPLPAPEPLTFTGGVGEFDFSWETDNTNLSTDDVFKVRLKVQGNGDLKSLKAPILDLQSDSFEVFPPKIIGEDRNEYRNGTLLSLRVYEYMITPLKVGSYKVPVDVCFFSPDSMDYINSPELVLNLNISKGKGLNFKTLPTQEDPNTEKISLQNIDPNKIIGNQNKNHWVYHWSFWLVLALPLSLTGGLWLKDRYEDEYAEEHKAKERMSKALQNAKTELNQLKEDSSKSNTERYNTLNNIVYSYVANRFGKGTSIQNIQSTVKLLRVEEIPEDQIDATEKLLKENEMFAFGMPTELNFETFLEKTATLLKQLD